MLVGDTDDRIVDWSIEAIFNWKNKDVPSNVYHIHGSEDKIFPIRYLHQPIALEKATHFMIANRAKEVSDIIQKIISGTLT